MKLLSWGADIIEESCAWEILGGRGAALYGSIWGMKEVFFIISGYMALKSLRNTDAEADFSAAGFLGS